MARHPSSAFPSRARALRLIWLSVAKDREKIGCGLVKLWLVDRHRSPGCQHRAEQAEVATKTGAVGAKRAPG